MTKMNAARFALGFAALAALVGCGGGGGSAPAPAPTPAPVPAASVTSMEPADGSTKVDIRPSLKIVFDGALDASSVTTEHVQLLAKGYPQIAAVSYDDATHTITVILPALAHDTTYTLSAHDLVDAAGKPVAARQSRFATWINNQAGYESDTARYTLDANGRPVQYPMDDDYDAYGVDTYTDAGLLATVETWYRGNDLYPNTADDRRTSIATHAYDSNGALLSVETRYDATVGGQVSNAWRDTRETYGYDAHGNVSRFTTVHAASDGLLGTADDTFIVTDSTYDPVTGRLASQITRTGTGADPTQLSNTTIASFGKASLAPDGISERWAYYGVGPDGLPFTADDVVGGYSDRTYDALGNRVKTVGYSDEGTPGTFHVVSSQDRTYDTRGNLVKIVLNSDFATPGTVSMTNYTINTYDAHDNLVRRTTCSDPGPDGLWFTADDLTGFVDYDTSH